jgi:predicted nucleotidyltransferase
MSPTTAIELADRLRPVVASDPGVLAAWLFGSTARGTSGPLSDVDVAVLPVGDDPDLRLRLAAAVAAAVAPRRADVVFLDEAPVALAYRVLRGGRVLSSRDDDARVEFWVRTVDRWLDMAPARRILADGLRARLREGSFGRP